MKKGQTDAATGTVGSFLIEWLPQERMMMSGLVWYRRDLRTIDCAPLALACKNNDRVDACFLVSAGQWRRHGLGPNHVEYMRRSLASLADQLAELNIQLHVKSVDTYLDAPKAIHELARDLACTNVHWGREHEVDEVARDKAVRNLLSESGLQVHEHDDQVVVPPGSVRTGSDTGYKVFTPYRKAWLPAARDHVAGSMHERPEPMRQPPPPPAELPEVIPEFEGFVPMDAWPVGEVEASKTMKRFVRERGSDYGRDRDIPSVHGTSRLGAALAVGALSPRTCVAMGWRHAERHPEAAEGLNVWISELAWRDFYKNVVHEFPHVCRNRAFKPETEQVAWRDDEASFKAWCEGRTGYPIVDSAMRCLVATGWMHNRLRMVTSQFLSKHLLIDWRRGEAFFARHLIDMDFASNNGGWQWSSSTGTDAAPYFRVFNPTTQGRRFDPDGAFIRSWIPELSDLPAREIHEPSKMTGGLWNPSTYPQPIVDQSAGRTRAIKAFADTRNAGE